MKTIWKFSLAVTDRQAVRMPRGAEILAAQAQAGALCLWARVDPRETAAEARRIEIYGTGHPLPDDPGAYVGTAQIEAFVWHVFDATAKGAPAPRRPAPQFGLFSTVAAPARLVPALGRALGRLAEAAELSALLDVSTALGARSGEKLLGQVITRASRMLAHYERDYPPAAEGENEVPR